MALQHLYARDRDTSSCLDWVSRSEDSLRGRSVDTLPLAAQYHLVSIWSLRSLCRNQENHRDGLAALGQSMRDGLAQRGFVVNSEGEFSNLSEAEIVTTHRVAARLLDSELWALKGKKILFGLAGDGYPPAQVDYAALLTKWYARLRQGPSHIILNHCRAMERSEPTRLCTTSERTELVAAKKRVRELETELLKETSDPIGPSPQSK
jgi:hypothetical protein